ncbi:28S ribosomal protein S7, mitochondrial [Tachyglossus aculeatus]|uniref:28S ribosomal protein S7, mitochondrial n=1 Tax=Tachyglossus aculeatus TaxID=9261 RepID=UPI0018F6EEA6|nr:28S ribosomal protein S7, mitochondrial [Tachyglossus aculeatus]
MAAVAQAEARAWRVTGLLVGLRQGLRACLPGLTQVRWSRYSPDYQEPQLDKAAHRKPVGEMTEEEKYARELRATQLIKAAPASRTTSVFQDPTISKFTNMMMKGGNKVLAQSLMLETLETVKRKQFEKFHATPEQERGSVERNPYVVFHQALKNCQPIIGLVSVLKGGHSYQVPAPLDERRRRFLAMKWLITECRRGRKPRRMPLPEKLAHELLEAFHHQGPVVKRKHEMHKMAEANRAFAHYRWW